MRAIFLRAMVSPIRRWGRALPTPPALPPQLPQPLRRDRDRGVSQRRLRRQMAAARKRAKRIDELSSRNSLAVAARRLRAPGVLAQPLVLDLPQHVLRARGGPVVLVHVAADPLGDVAARRPFQLAVDLAFGGRRAGQARHLEVFAPGILDHLARAGARAERK